MLDELWTVGVLPIVVLGLGGWYAAHRTYRFMASDAGTKAVVAVMVLVTLAEVIWAAAYITMAPIVLIIAAYFGSFVLVMVAGLSVGLSTVMSLNYLRVRSGRLKGVRLLISGIVIAASMVALWVYLYRKFVV